MKHFFLIVFVAFALSACQKESTQKAETPAPAEFLVVDGASAESVAELNTKKDEVISQVLARHELDPSEVDVRVGAPSGLGVTVEVGLRLTMVEHAYTHFRITLHAFWCRLTDGEPKCLDCAAIRWVLPEDLDELPMSVADRKIARALRAEVNGEPKAEAVSSRHPWQADA